MNLIGEIMGRSGLSELFAGSRCYYILGGGGYFEGVKSLGKYTPSEIEMNFPQGLLTVSGKGLGVKKYCDGDVELSGKILSVVLTENGKNGDKNGDKDGAKSKESGQ